MHHRGEVLDADRGEAATDVVLNGLDVVDRDGFDVSEFRDRSGIELGDDGAQLLLLFGGQGTGAWKYVVAGQVDEPLDLDGHAVAVERGLGQVVDQGSDGGLVPAVQGAQCDRLRRRGESNASRGRTGNSGGDGFRHEAILS